MRSTFAAVLLVVLIPDLVVNSDNAHAGGLESCGVSGPGSPTQITIPATPYRSGFLGLNFRYREVEFIWDAAYTPTITSSVAQTLDTFAVHLADRPGTSPLVTDALNTEALYLYMNRAARGWSLNPLVLNASMQLGDSNYPAADYSHADAYITHPGTAGTGGIYPADVVHPDEDLTSGHASGDVLHANAIRFAGPLPPNPITDPTGTGWTAVGSRAFIGFNHELQHSMLPHYLSLNDAFPEMLSAAAEAVAGIGNSDVFSEVPYTWSLLAWSTSQAQPPFPITDPNFHNRFSLNNYQARTSFMSYLAYNFLNANAARTKAGMVDDLLYKWIHGPRLDLVGISAQLNDVACSDCLSKSYFRPGGVPLSDHDRLQVLHHNWRVANFVNNPALAEGQFGFPAFGGFSPVQSQRAWQNIDGFTQDDIVALPAIVTLDASAITRETSFLRQRTFRGKTHPMTLVPFSANYWVIRPGAQVATQDRDLVVRISPRSFFKAGTFLSLGRNDLRLMASVVAYSQADVGGDETNLYNLPTAAVYSTPAKWVDCDSLAGDIELIVPSFGVTHKAAVVVVSLGDGPKGEFSELSAIGYREDLPYRLDISLRSTPSLSQQASVVSAASTQPDDWPTWAPGSDELAYSAVDFAVAALFQIYRRRLDGSAPIRVAPQAMNQFTPDWSPRGDLIVFESRPAADQSDLYLAGTVQQTVTRLTSMPGCELLPSFQPNGRGVAYYFTAGPGQPWSLRWIGVDGSGDREVAANVTPSGTPPRWSADGQFIIVHDSALRRLMRHSIAGGASQQDPSGILDIDSFDVHPGIGRLALSSSSPLPNTSFDFPEFSLPGPITSRRVALLDTSSSARDTSYRFVERGRQSRNVRWSPDGCAIAYARSIDGTADRDLYAGRLTWNRAPAFTSLMNDKGIPACVPFQFFLQGFDPDGEALTFKADYLPSGAQFINGTTFRWQHPSVGEFFVVFRALDGSGGVDRRVLKISVSDEGDCGDPIQEGDGGCGACLVAGLSAVAPAAELYEGPTDASTNSYLNGVTPDSWTTQIARVGRVAYDTRNRGLVSLTATAAGSLALDMARVHVIDHPSDVKALATSSGVVVGRLAPIEGALDRAGRDVLTGLSVARWMGESLELPARTELVVSWTATSGIAGLAIDCSLGGELGVGPELGIEVQTADGSGWRTIDRVIPRRKFDLLGSLTPGANRVRLVLLGSAHLRAISGLVLPPGLEAECSRATIQIAETDREGGELALASAGGGALELRKGERVSLSFALPGEPGPRFRSQFLELRATYSPPTGSWSAKGQGLTEATPAQFSLLQNQPNPFAGTTRLQLELPRVAEVRVDVFDPLGRLVRTVFSGSLGAGSHALVWDGRDERGGAVGPGVYHCRVSAGSYRAEKRMVMLAR